MGTKTLIRLLIVLAVIGGIAAILHFAGSGGGVSEVTATTNKTKVFSDFPINDIAGIHVKSKDGELSLVKGDENWEVVERDGYPADAAGVASVLIGERLFPVIARVSSNHTIVELGDEPGVSVGDIATLIGRRTEALPHLHRVVTRRRVDAALRQVP